MRTSRRECRGLRDGFGWFVGSGGLLEPRGELVEISHAIKVPRERDVAGADTRGRLHACLQTENETLRPTQLAVEFWGKAEDGSRSRGAREVRRHASDASRQTRQVVYGFSCPHS